MSWLCPACDSVNSEEYSAALGIDENECYACGWNPGYSADETEEKRAALLADDDSEYHEEPLDDAESDVWDD